MGALVKRGKKPAFAKEHAVRATHFVFVTCTLLACSKTESKTEPAPAASTAATSATTTAAVASSAAASAAATGTAPANVAAPGAATAYEGDYKSVASTLYVPDEKLYKGFRFRGDEVETGIGPGTMKLKVDPTGRVEGTGEGSLGAFLVSGFFKDGMLTGTIFRKEKDGGFTGSILGETSKTGVDGSFKVSLGQGNVLRSGTFNLKTK